jgi:RimJ/RimL family protein N-acetyltransferase
MATAARTIEKTRRLEPLETVEVRYPFPDSALPQLWDWLNGKDNKTRKMVADDDAPETLDEFIDSELERTEAGARKFAVWRGDELGGCIWAEEVNIKVQNAVQAHCVFKSDFFGHKTTLPALLQMAQLIFEAGYKKIEMPVFNHNNPIKALLKRAGAHSEGVSRAHTTQDGQPVDVALYAFFDTDFQKLYPDKGDRHGKRETSRTDQSRD